MTLQQRINSVLGDRWSRWFTVSLLFGNLGGWAAVWFLAPRNLDVSPLHYTIYFGINLTGPWTSLFWLPAIGLGAIITHLTIAHLANHILWRRLWLVLAAVIN